MQTDEDIGRAERYITSECANAYLLTLEADARMIQERIAEIRRLKYE
jgi:hypothetical protein